ncbi:unnamed protein product [Lupinus luteus]|uniref:DUF3741 domain-containing protein n=1 Tax=Lupinus luteus TaxID=3873 RepID=A0AAV1WA45_LUPLU
MPKAEKAKSACFYGFLQVLLCPGNGTSPSLHPFGNVIKSEKIELLHSKKDRMVDEYEATPGVVARLMGLDSLPKTNFPIKGATQHSVPRSRSVTFVDYLLEFDLNQSNNHRRVKTSASFHKVPAMAQWRNRDLSEPYWGDDESNGEEAKLKKTENGLDEWKQKKKQGRSEKEILKERVSTVKKEWNQGKNKKIYKLRNEPRKVPSSYKRSRMVRKRQCEVKDLSNVSSRSNSTLLNKRKKENSHNTSPLTLKSKCKSSSLLSFGNVVVEDKTSNNEGCAYNDLNREVEYYSELLLKLRILTEKDIRESNNNPTCMYGNEGYEEICLLFEQNFLDLLLDEFVDDVVGLSCWEFCHLGM